MKTFSEEKYCSLSLETINFYIESGFWSKPKKQILTNWLNNFKEPFEKYCAVKLLMNFLYYSEEDIIRLLEYGLFEKIFSKYLLKKEISSGFSITNKELLEFRTEFEEGIRFIPLQTGNVSESSTLMTRHLTNELGINEKTILDIKNLKKEDFKDVKNVILIDDFIGTGTQIHTFWNFTQVSLDGEELIGVKKLKEIFSEGVDFEYFCLVATEEGLENLTQNNFEQNTALKVTFCEKLTDIHKVFGANSIYFEDDEIDECREVLEKLSKQNKIKLYGYNQSDYAIAFHHSIPDCSLPLFFKENNSWNTLYRNKKTKSDDYIY